MKRMKLKELLKNCDSGIEITGVTCDSRKVENGYAFVCINGTDQDGHDYAASAAENGAAAIICERDLGLDNQFIVTDTREAFADMSAAWFGHPAEKLKLIGITGTNGKTSVAHIIKNVLENLGHKTGMIGTICNMIGQTVHEAKNTTPSAFEINKLFAEMVENGCEYVVMEVSSHALDQKRVYGLHFKVAVFTNLTQDHLDYHKTMENYLAAKKKLFYMCDTAVINLDDRRFKELTDGLQCKIVTYSAKSDEATFTAKNINYRPRGVDYEMVSYGLISRVRMGIPGKFTVYNSLAAAVTMIELGFSIYEVTKVLSSAPGIKGRAEIVPTDTDYTIVIDYAHTPDGLLNILSTFKECPKNRLIAVFGCGGDRDKKKRPIMGEIAARNSDFVIVTSDNPRTEDPAAIIKEIVSGMKNTVTPYKIVENRIDAIKYAMKIAQPNDIIVLAGKGHETYQILGQKTIHLDEREVIKDVLEEKM